MIISEATGVCFAFVKNVTTETVHHLEYKECLADHYEGIFIDLSRPTAADWAPGAVFVSHVVSGTPGGIMRLEARSRCVSPPPPPRTWSY